MVNFNGTNGSGPEGSLIADANGDLFGTTAQGGASDLGTVFELVKSGSTYTLNTLVNFNGTNGSGPVGSLIADANGDLFGTISGGGRVTPAPYSNWSRPTPSTHCIRTGQERLANGDLFGTTEFGGTSE